MNKEFNNISTRQRLLEAAGAVFAEKGFHAASVREISDKAGANIASINYHFGDKEKLHEAILAHVFTFSSGKNNLDLKELQSLPPAKRLQKFIHTLLLQRLDPARPAWHRRLMGKEIAEPSSRFKATIQTNIKGKIQFLRQLIAELLNAKNPQQPKPNTTAEKILIERCVASTVGQCVYCIVAQNMIPLIYDGIDFSPQGLKAMAEHIATFSLAAIEGISKNLSKTTDQEDQK
jgi:TetR/AcrR family transcriptional regulator, regulator of cefoperazone and chloramphenicol sensitivity